MNDPKSDVAAWWDWFRGATGGYWETVKCVQCALDRDCSEHPNGDGNGDDTDPGEPGGHGEQSL